MVVRATTNLTQISENLNRNKILRSEWMWLLWQFWKKIEWKRFPQLWVSFTRNKCWFQKNPRFFSVYDVKDFMELYFAICRSKWKCESTNISAFYILIAFSGEFLYKHLLFTPSASALTRPVVHSTWYSLNHNKTLWIITYTLKGYLFYMDFIIFSAFRLRKKTKQR